MDAVIATGQTTAPPPCGRARRGAFGDHPLVRFADFRRVFVCSSGEVEELPRLRGAPLGLSTSIQVDEGVVALQPGDALLLYTDGLSELRSGDGWFGVDGIKRALSGMAGASSQHSLGALLDEARRLARNEMPDDIALLYLRWLRQGSVRPEPVEGRTSSG